jgi:hypothetical protein
MKKQRIQNLGSVKLDLYQIINRDNKELFAYEVCWQIGQRVTKKEN